MNEVFKNIVSSVAAWRCHARFFERTYRSTSLLLFLFFVLTACTPESPPPTPIPLLPTHIPIDLPVSAWGDVELIAQAQSREAPVFTFLSNRSLFAWTGYAQGEARHFSRGISGTAQIMAFKAFYPMEQELFAGNDSALMLWRDRSPNVVQTYLWAGVFSENGIADIGAIQMSYTPTRHYSAMRLDNERVQIVYSAGLGQINNLYRQQVDMLARPSGETELQVDADFPALLKQDENISLFWLENSGEDTFIANLTNAGLENARRITNLRLPFEKAVEDFFVAQAGETIYLFWQVRNFDGSYEFWMSTGSLESEFSSPQTLGFSIGTESQETPYQLEAIAATQSQENPIAWLTPAETVLDDSLALAVYQNNELGILLLQNGEVIAYSPVVSNTVLIAAPQLYIFEDGNLALSWSSPSEEGFANLFYTSSR